MTGTYGAARLNCAIAAAPHGPGMNISETISDTGASWSPRNAAWQLGALRTVYPSASRQSPKRSRTRSSSSTTRMVIPWFWFAFAFVMSPFHATAITPMYRVAMRDCSCNYGPMYPLPALSSGRQENQENDERGSQQQHHSGTIVLPPRSPGSVLCRCHCLAPPLHGRRLQYPALRKYRLTLARQAVDRVRQSHRGVTGCRMQPECEIRAIERVIPVLLRWGRRSGGSSRCMASTQSRLRIGPVSTSRRLQPPASAS